MGRLLTIFAASILVTACGGSSSGGGGDQQKPLFSLWNEVGGNEVLDLSGGRFSEALPWTFFPDSEGSQCNCSFTIIGTESEGNYVINSCFYVSGSSSSGDPGCNSLNQTGVYRKSSDTLRVCIAEPDCVEYK